MEVQSIYKFARMSPKKVREVAREMQGRSANEALEILRLIPRKSARLIGKTLQSAIANAENNHNMPSDTLVVHRCLVEEGPAFRRFKAGARGQPKPRRKRTSHIRVVLAEAAPAATS